MSDHVPADEISNLLVEIDNLDNLSILVKKVYELLQLRFQVSETIVDNMVRSILISTPLYPDLAVQVVSFLQQGIFEDELKFSLRMVINMYVALKKFNNKMLIRYNGLVQDYLVNYNYQQLPLTYIGINLELSKNILYAVHKDILFRKKHAWYAMTKHMDQLQILAHQGQESFRQVYHFYQFVLITLGSDPLFMKKD
jgi:hypothetical protein